MDARYSRQLALPGFGPAAQQRLLDARVLVIGAGGLGSHVLPALAAAGVGTIGIVDDDRVEVSNLHRQLVHGTEDVGTGKAASAGASIARLNDTVVELHEQRLVAADALALFARYDLVVDGSDNFPTRYLVADAATLTGIPLVWGAVSQYGGQASTSVPGGPGYRDLFPTPPPPGSVESCEVGGVLPTTVGVVGAIMATETIKLLTGIGSPLVGRVTTYDALGGGFRELRFSASSPPVTGLIDYDLFCGLGDSLTPGQLQGLDGVTLIDVREAWEAEIAALSGALLIPLGSLPEVVDRLDPDAEFVVYCHHGVRSQRGLEILHDAGLSARHLAGGIDAWAREIDPTMARY